MKRPEQHETDSRGSSCFNAVFSKWAVTEIRKDYGLDYVVEVFRENVSTGLFFNAQLKSSRHPLRDRSLDRLALETANPKIIHCKLHNYKLDGRDLDDIDTRFNEKFVPVVVTTPLGRSAGHTFQIGMQAATCRTGQSFSHTSFSVDRRSGSHPQSKIIGSS